MYIIHKHTSECTPNFALWEGICCGCDHRNCPAHNGADSKHARCVSDTTHVHTMVEALQLSGQVTSFQVPSEIMGLFSAGSGGAGGVRY